MIITWTFYVKMLSLSVNLFCKCDLFFHSNSNFYNIKSILKNFVDFFLMKTTPLKSIGAKEPVYLTIKLW